MILSMVDGSISIYFWGFRLLNSEIGNDQKRHNLGQSARHVGFRLLNSEIGNDPFTANLPLYDTLCFRLLNSEIGNDRAERTQGYAHIGVFVSLTRR